jgi:gluconokinase
MSSTSDPIATSDTKPRLWLLMGVSGCGKTVVGERLAQRLGARFVDADDLHPPENKVKMSASIPLTDDDRRPWLERIRREVIDAAPNGGTTVLACSALKRDYRLVLMDGAPGVQLIHLHGPQELIAERLATRKGHFMPRDLLCSQFETLEPPGVEEGAVVSIAGSVEEVVDRCLGLL